MAHVECHASCVRKHDMVTMKYSKVEDRALESVLGTFIIAHLSYAAKIDRGSRAF